MHGCHLPWVRCRNSQAPTHRAMYSATRSSLPAQCLILVSFLDHLPLISQMGMPYNTSEAPAQSAAYSAAPELHPTHYAPMFQQHAADYPLQAPTQVSNPPAVPSVS